MNKLVLFDIDGTLVKSIPGNPHAIAFEETLENLYGIKAQLDWPSIAGLTDQLIFKQMLEAEGWSAQKIETEMPALIEEIGRVYVSNFVSGSVETMPGIDDTLEQLEKLGVRMALLTGNVDVIAKTKLTDVGIFKYFDGGGFGSDPHSKRSDLVELAVKRAGMTDSVDDVYLIGDTPRDMKGALDGGLHHAIGFAASHHGVDELFAAGAESVIESYKDWPTVAAALHLTVSTNVGV